MNNLLVVKFIEHNRNVHDGHSRIYASLFISVFAKHQKQLKKPVVTFSLAVVRLLES